MKRPLLTISIPTYNRASYLEILLGQLQKEVATLKEPDIVEVLISDNASPDKTEQVVQQSINQGLTLRYLRNDQNIGSDRNIAQAFNEASGSYVLIMGDDDVLVDGALVTLLARLNQLSPGVLLLGAYGYELDFKTELPRVGNGYFEFTSAGKFLRQAGAKITLISACVINKEIIKSADANSFIGENLVQVHLVLRALLATTNSVICNEYSVACKRNNSGGYLYAEVFVKNLGNILDSYITHGLSNDDVLTFDNHLLRAHHPYYVWRNLRLGQEALELSKTYFDNRFNGNLSYWVLIKPMFFLPRPLAWLWGLFSTIISRIVFGGDLIRAFYFIKNRLMRFSRFVCFSFKAMGNNPPC